MWFTDFTLSWICDKHESNKMEVAINKEKNKSLLCRVSRIERYALQHNGAVQIITLDIT